MICLLPQRRCSCTRTRGRRWKERGRPRNGYFPTVTVATSRAFRRGIPWSQTCADVVGGPFSLNHQQGSSDPSFLPSPPLLPSRRHHSQARCPHINSQDLHPSSLLLSPTPKCPVESAELWTELLDCDHGDSVAHKVLAPDENPRAGIVGVTFILRSSFRPRSRS